MTVVHPDVRPGQVWESRDSRDLGKGPVALPPAPAGRRHRRRVRVIRVHDGLAHVMNVVSGKETHIKLDIFTSGRSRGGFVKVEDAPPTYEYIVNDLDGNVMFRLTRSMLKAGFRIARRGPMSSDYWEDLDG